MNDALRQAASVDPEWAKKEQRRQWLVKVTVAGTLIALAAGVIAIALSVHNGTEITRVKTQVEHSACQTQPAGGECQRAKRRAAEAESISTACIPFHQTGYPCPKPGSEVAERAAEGGGATSSPSTGHSLPGRHEGGSSGTTAPGNGGSHRAPVPGEGGSEAAPASGTATAPAPTAPSSPGTSSSSTTERTTESTVVERSPAPEAEAPVRSATGALVESVGATVEGLGETAGGAVEGVEATTCTLAKLLCP